MDTIDNTARSIATLAHARFVAAIGATPYETAAEDFEGWAAELRVVGLLRDHDDDEQRARAFWTTAEVEHDARFWPRMRELFGVFAQLAAEAERLAVLGLDATRPEVRAAMQLNRWADLRMYRPEGAKLGAFRALVEPLRDRYQALKAAETYGRNAVLTARMWARRLGVIVIVDRDVDTHSAETLAVARARARGERLAEALYRRIIRQTGAPVDGRGRVVVVDLATIGVRMPPTIAHEIELGERYSSRKQWRKQTHVWTLVAPLAAIEAALDSMNESPDALAIVRRGKTRVAFFPRKTRGLACMLVETAVGFSAAEASA